MKPPPNSPLTVTDMADIQRHTAIGTVLRDLAIRLAAYMPPMPEGAQGSVSDEEWITIGALVALQHAIAGLLIERSPAAGENDGVMHAQTRARLIKVDLDLVILQVRETINAYLTLETMGLMDYAYDTDELLEELAEEDEILAAALMQDEP